MEEAGLTFRPYNGNDLPFLHSSWGSSYYGGNKAHRVLTPDEFHASHRHIRTRFFDKQNKKILVCSPNDDPWHIMGWIAIEAIPSAQVLHYIYVKDAFKHQGISTRLLKHALRPGPTLYTHLTERGARIMSNKYERFREFKYVPHLI